MLLPWWYRVVTIESDEVVVRSQSRRLFDHIRPVRGRSGRLDMHRRWSRSCRGLAGHRLRDGEKLYGPSRGRWSMLGSDAAGLVGQGSFRR
jgi:hypothetical protein